MDDPQDLLLPFAFKAVERLLEEGDALNRQVEDSRKKIALLQVENRELQELLVASER
jgi:predicted RNA-binding protein with EMAP domain